MIVWYGNVYFCISISSYFSFPICTYKKNCCSSTHVWPCCGILRTLQLYFSDSTRSGLLLGTDGCLPARSSGTKTIWRENFAQRHRHNHPGSTCFQIFSISQVLTFAFLVRHQNLTNTQKIWSVRFFLLHAARSQELNTYYIQGVFLLVSKS